MHDIIKAMASYNDEPPPSYDSVCNYKNNTETKRVSYINENNYPCAQHNCSIQNPSHDLRDGMQNNYTRDGMQNNYTRDGMQNNYTRDNYMQNDYTRNDYQQNFKRIYKQQTSSTAIENNGLRAALTNYNYDTDICNYIKQIRKNIVRTNNSTQNQKSHSMHISYRINEYGI